jgi:hypothetical protein
MGSFFNTGCTSVYTSQGSGVKELLTVWQPEDGHSMGMAGTSKYVCVGYYASVDAASPQGACVLRITDTSSMFNTSALDWVLTRFTPHPKGYNLVWAKQVGVHAKAFHCAETPCVAVFQVGVRVNLGR